MLDNSTPKYLNTAETQWFNKRRLLFGLDIALKAIRKSGKAVVVEGYMDAISLHAAGFDNVVASMGTAFPRSRLSCCSVWRGRQSSAMTVTVPDVRLRCGQ